jgi:hypothetical protein
VTSRERLFDAALGKGWSAASTSDRMVMVRSGVVITVWFTRNGSVRTALFEYEGHVDRINGGVPAIITELER